MTSVATLLGAELTVLPTSSTILEVSCKREDLRLRRAPSCWCRYIVHVATMEAIAVARCIEPLSSSSAVMNCHLQPGIPNLGYGSAYITQNTSYQLQTTSSLCVAAPKNPDSPSTPNPAWRLPITGFGPFGPTSGCKGDRWPNGHCTMKIAADPAAPAYWRNPGEASGKLHSPCQISLPLPSIHLLTCIKHLSDPTGLSCTYSRRSAGQQVSRCGPQVSRCMLAGMASSPPSSCIVN
jgi:hypothetical protein